MNKYMALAIILSLSGCGVDVATTAVTVGKAKAEEVKDAQKTKEHVTDQIDAAMAASQQQLKDADQAGTGQ
ncbi:MAG: hypothetical protein HY940_02615 [Gammaproteobacteria bacterium]|nr:hypothetical protein [Gammaproteobacteria bacterium]